jgi:hypothetical protein
MCLQAAGTLFPGYTIRRRSGLTILERTPTHPPPIITPLYENQAAARAISTAWSKLTNSEQATWQAAVPEHGDSPYHAYLKANMRAFRQQGHLYGIYPYNPITQIGAVGSPGTQGGPRRISFRPTLTSNQAGFMLAIMRRPYPNTPPRDPRMTCLWRALPAGTRWYHELNVPPGVWTCFLVVIHKSGWAWPPKGPYNVPVLP